MMEPGLDRHDWESELASLEDDIRDYPQSALPELDSLVGRMLEETGVDENDDARKEFAAAREVMRLAEAGNEEISAGDVAAAVASYRAVFDYVITLGLPAES